jgi:hypothetical protein
MFRGRLQGRVSLVDRVIAATATIENIPADLPGPPLAALALGIDGPWTQVMVAPEMTGVILRSGAAHAEPD